MRFYFHLALILFAVVAFYSFVLPQYREVKDIRAAQDTASDLLERLVSLEQNIFILEELYSQVGDENVNLIQQAIPVYTDNTLITVNFDINDFIREFVFFDEENISFDIGAFDTAGDRYVSVPITFNGSGSYEEIKDFLNYFNRWFKAFEVRNFSVSNKESNSEERFVLSPPLDFTIQIDLFYLKMNNGFGFILNEDDISI